MSDGPARPGGTSGAGRRRRRLALAGLAAVLLGAAGAVAYLGSTPAPGQPAAAVGRAAAPPPPQGYFELRPPGAYRSLPDDAEAARAVHRSSWEIRPENARFNRTEPPALRLVPRDDAARGYDPLWNQYVTHRITGRFHGTTDEIFQWAAVKWGVPDNVLRTVAMMESDWRQSNQGDDVTDPSRCPPGYSVPCPVTFGIVGTKSTSWPGVFPWNRDSTATAVDVLGGWLRGCYEGWVWWLRDHGSRELGVYAAGDIWGCVGAWASGNWHDLEPGRASGERYLRRSQQLNALRPWLEPGF
ncbi:MAG TPA: hypothetical protein VI357_21755 [Mycobacteriales bacterium]